MTPPRTAPRGTRTATTTAPRVRLARGRRLATDPRGVGLGHDPSSENAASQVRCQPIRGHSLRHRVCAGQRRLGSPRDWSGCWRMQHRVDTDNTTIASSLGGSACPVGANPHAMSFLDETLVREFCVAISCNGQCDTGEPIEPGHGRPPTRCRHRAGRGVTSRAG